MKQLRNIKLLASVIPVVLAAVGCARPATQDAGAPQIVKPYVVDAATVQLTFPDANAVLTPLKTTAATAAFKSAEQAFTVVHEGVTAMAAEAGAGPAKVGLYHYSNSAHGQIQPDGSVKLDYQNVPVWLVTQPLTHYLNLSQGRPNASSSSAPVTHSGCSFRYIVKASDGTFITSWEECTTNG
ncbi:MAG: hypothetical protein ACR2P2_06615 [Nakamurella sp.]